MDLGATAQIDRLEIIAQENGISVPRLRGYRLMSECEPYTEEEIQEQIRDIKSSYRFMHEPLSRIWDIEHDVRKQCGLWNKYAGRDDVLYIHSRCRGADAEMRAMPWYLDDARDAFDGTYCDIYAKIEPVAKD